MHSRLSIQQLLERTSARFAVPAFQRQYMWGEEIIGRIEPASNLIDHIVRAFEASKELFLMSILLKRRDNGEHEIVDGHQRFIFLYILLKRLGFDGEFEISYDSRKRAEAFLKDVSAIDSDDLHHADTRDIYCMQRTVSIIDNATSHLDKSALLRFILSNVTLHLNVTMPDERAVTCYSLLNGTKSQMSATDLIKADILRLMSDPRQEDFERNDVMQMRAQYAHEWENWLAWWNRADVRKYYCTDQADALDLMMSLLLRTDNTLIDSKLSHSEFHAMIKSSDATPWHAAKHFFIKARRTQKKFEEAYACPETYNRIKAILLLQSYEDGMDFLRAYFVDFSVSKEQLVEYYKLSFLGMSISDIRQGKSAVGKFDELLASIRMADVYHTDGKRDAYNLLLRLNIDEDIRLSRRFDFSIWNNRSLEHIYSKSKVWHYGKDGKIYDGNDNPLPMSRRTIEKDRTFMWRDNIVGRNGIPLTEHCIGNLVLLYGENNAAFGNASFAEKKQMFLSPGETSVFKSRNLLHSVCVFAGNNWTHKSIVENYFLTLKNLKDYYGFK